MWKKLGIGIQTTDDCRVKILEETDPEGPPFCLWLGRGDFPILGDLADFGDIAQGILTELVRHGFFIELDGYELNEGRKGDVSRNPAKDSSNGIQGV